MKKNCRASAWVMVRTEPVWDTPPAPPTHKGPGGKFRAVLGVWSGREAV